ncbi:Uma2 family endonuclease [[Limnothrix rosea] IAM M-220]|uniref:Uma2 family endonuclease n=1 Tax=[Limnothrix rosea] IAM M-220 TaxID=454133 RepID=UPI00095ADEA5|nr:Uma2 family endonuclease [[Limnothrix rosea] IAM M-220]OKH19412.1 hypothetical protein NIES208_02555 [[Limnothrix rosea] IAM M-220]
MVSTFPVPTEPILRLSVAQYHAMIQAGILTEDDPVELINGWLVEKMPKNPRHRVATKLLRTLLENSIPKGYYVDSQEPITLSDSEPEPDVMVIQGETRDYLEGHPQAENIVLIVEVSDSTLGRDRQIKKELYARHNIQNYWILNLVDNKIEVFSQPESSQLIYASELVFGFEEAVQISLNAEIEIAFSTQQVLP